jgi:predicted ArsR family transcriptional regulator
MQTSKDRILAVLKRFGSRSVDDLAAALQLAPMTVRQHLTALERDEFVRVSEYRNGAGRPKHYYSLTDRGDAAFPRRYDRFAALLLTELQQLEPTALAEDGAADRMGLVLERLARRESAPHLARLSLLDPAERAHAAAVILHEIGGFAEAVETPAGIEIRDYNCVYRGLRPQESGPCAWHARLLPHLVRAPVEELPPEPHAGRCCRLLVHCEPAPAAHLPEGQNHDYNFQRRSVS